MLDFDLAVMYGIETRILKQSVKRNLKRFEGDDFMFEPTKDELSRSQFVILNKGRGSNMKYLPFAFTEPGVAMLSSVLNSDTAIEINRGIMRAFAAMRKEMSIVKEWRTVNFRKEEFRILSHFYKCEDTGEQFEDEKLSELNNHQVLNQYRTKYSIPFPDQIKSIRNKYGVSASKMADILGFGANCYRQYEAGEVPSQSNARLIQLVNDPHEFKKLVDLSVIDDKGKIYKNIDALLVRIKEDKERIQLEKYFLGNCLPNEFTGYKVSDLGKFSEMVVFFSDRLKPWKTKLNKLLFYSDFLNFKLTGYSMSGIQYRAITLGPVPNNFQTIYEYLENKGAVQIISKSFQNGALGEQFASDRDINEELFSETEIDILEHVCNKFEATSTNEIVELSHEEKAWIENKDKCSMIDYRYAYDLVNV